MCHLVDVREISVISVVILKKELKYLRLGFIVVVSIAGSLPEPG